MTDNPRPINLQADAFNRSLARAGLTLNAVARQLNVSLKTVQGWSNGRRNAPNSVIAWLDAIATAIDAIGAPDGWQHGEKPHKGAE